MRTIETIDAELRVLAAYRQACVADGRPARSSVALDRLLDERSVLADAGPGDQGAVGA